MHAITCMYEFRTVSVGVLSLFACPALYYLWVSRMGNCMLVCIYMIGLYIHVPLMYGYIYIYMYIYIKEMHKPIAGYIALDRVS